MFTVFLGVNGAILINWLSPGEKFNSGLFCEKILEPLSEILHVPRCRYFILTVPHLIGQL
jgi:hypothetical protein